ncbi:MAG TPA: hypothetical protein VMG12_23820 [Polyangiaceae bacterium]|nr:hypothetical protein [Polyangiaceae bacterium]
MPRRVAEQAAYVGVADHWGWAILVTVDGDGRCLDRRRVELVEAGVPAYPHHHEAQRLPLEEAVALVERVRRSVAGCAEARLEALAASVPLGIGALALRVCPPLPATLPERLSNYTAQNVADSVMYREALARAATARGWALHWYEARHVLAQAAKTLGRESIQELLDATGVELGRPWTKEHRLAMAAAIAAGGART